MTRSVEDGASLAVLTIKGGKLWIRCCGRHGDHWCVLNGATTAPITTKRFATRAVAEACAKRLKARVEVFP